MESDFDTTITADTPPRRTDIAAMLLDRLGDAHPGLRTRTQDWTWDEVVRESAARAALARELRRDGPFHIGVLLDNVPDFVFWLGAAALSGATVAGLNPTRSDSQLAADIRYVDCQLIVTDTAGMARLRGLDLGLGPDRLLLVDDPDQTKPIDTHGVEAVTAEGGSDSLLLLLFTSGTTGTSKAVKCTQRRLAMIAYAATDKFGHVREDVDYCCMPLFHGNALMALWAPALANGATICLTPKFSASGFLSDIQYFDATFFTYVGKALGYLLATPESDADSDNRLVRGFGTEASVADQAEFRRRFGAELFEGYGSSEGSGLVALAPDAPAGALGVPAHAGVAIVDPDTLLDRARAVLDPHGRVLNPDEAIGEMVDKAGALFFEGYYKNDAADAERLRHGWFWTGDLGYVDEAGFLYFAGRQGDWIRVDGENISALVIERVLRRHPAVVATGVFAVPDPRSGDQVMAAVEVADPAVFDIGDFTEFLCAQDDLGAKDMPRLLRVSARLPVTGSNKVLKRELRAQSWCVADPVYRWAGRGGPEYRLLSASDRAEFEAEFTRFGRGHLL
ncbi:AMP-binding protein [Nocardia sp. 2]|uniref:AMP-binding protein n=1 Tax=Nocardia acididurans TaxID=2802282 RepID=A0ABS1MF63_9NOCA|nr:AMP-binding protein [Nocardia acididurans]MBL1078906.1 AMP-binding protein [Nocardia acididurans]